MKLHELFEQFNTDTDLIETIKDYLIALKANNVSEVPMDMLIQDIKNKFKIEINASDLQNVLRDIPLVKDSNEETIFLNTPPDHPEEPEMNSKEQVSQMASSGSKAAESERI